MPRGGESWSVLTDVLGPVEFWPQYVVDTFWKKRWSYRNRLVIATFCYGNGCSLELAIDFYREFRKPGTQLNKLTRHLRQLEDWFDNSPIIRARYNYYDLVECKVLDLNGLPIIIEPGNHRRIRYHVPTPCRNNQV